MVNGRIKEVMFPIYDIISRLPDYWDHNQQYQNYVLNYQINRNKTFMSNDTWMWKWINDKITSAKM